MRFSFLLLGPILAAAVFGGCSSGGESTPGQPPANEQRPEVPPVTQGESDQSKEKPKDSNTTLTIGIAAEEHVLAYFDHADVTAKVDGAVAMSKTFHREEGKKMFPYELVLAAPAASPAAKVEVTISGYTSPQAVDAIVTRLVSTSFVAGKAKLAYV